MYLFHNIFLCYSRYDALIIMDLHSLWICSMNHWTHPQFRSFLCLTTQTLRFCHKDPFFCDNITWAERFHREPLWESQQCEWLLMACNGRGVWAVYCCFDKLLMTCVVRGLHAQSERKAPECWEKETARGRKKRHWKRGRAICLPLSHV